MSKEVSVSELRAKGNNELNDRVAELKKEIFLSCSAAVGNEGRKPNIKKRASRKEMAKILTIQRERELNEVPSEPLL